MSDEKALLAAIWEHPHEDTPRIMYADWLQENGQPERAEFIRVQCELAKLDDDAPGYGRLAEREAKLLNAHREHWVGSVRVWCAFERGFPYPSLGREISAIQLEKASRRQLQAAPLWEVGVRAGNSDRIVPLASVANLRRVGKLSLRGTDRRGELLSALSPSPEAVHVTELNWLVRDTGAEVFHALAQPGVMPQLHRLRVHAGFDEGTAATLTRSPLAGRVTRLAVPLTGAGVRVLFADGAFAQLTELNVVWNDPPGTLPGGRYVTVGGRGYSPDREGDAIIDALVACSLPGLRRLRLRQGGITTAGAEALAGWEGARPLRRLDLSSMNASHDIGTAGVRALVESPFLAGLVSLTVKAYGATRDEITRLLLDRFGSLVPPPPSTPYWITGGVAWPEPVWW